MTYPSHLMFLFFDFSLQHTRGYGRTILGEKHGVGAHGVPLTPNYPLIPYFCSFIYPLIASCFLRSSSTTLFYFSTSSTFFLSSSSFSCSLVSLLLYVSLPFLLFFLLHLLCMLWLNSIIC